MKKRPSTDFMEIIQKDINASMRAILIDWLVEVTYFLCVTNLEFPLRALVNRKFDDYFLRARRELISF